MKSIQTMPETYRIGTTLAVCLFFFANTFPTLQDAPPITVVVVIDQWAQDYVPKLKENFHYGLKELFKNGISYEEAYYPHGVPETTTGHSNLSTGTFPKDHGGVTNQWIDVHGKKISYAEDTHPSAALLPNPQPKPTGRSSANTMVDTLSDQFMMQSTAKYQGSVFALSLKDYPAIAIAGKLGKAIWFNDKTGLFTSSKAYFQKIPDWIEDINKTILPQAQNFIWKTRYATTSSAYHYPFINNYDYAGAKQKFIGANPLNINAKDAPPFFTFARTPLSSKILFDLAKECINNNTPSKNTRMLLWVSLSNLDLLTHLFGPDSMEAIDTIYHLDKQLDDFMKFLHQKYGAGNYLLAVTADHGIAPIPELQQKKGFSAAHRIMANDLVKAINKQVEIKHGITHFVQTFEPNSFRFDHTISDQLDPEKKDAVIRTIKTFLLQQPGIRKAWTYEELDKKTFKTSQFGNFYKNQLYPGRMGDLICLPAPYCQITHYKTGTSHSTPYNYDTHVPLILYQKGVLPHKVITKKVWMTQFAGTLAHLVHIPQPSASPFELLPGF